MKNIKSIVTSLATLLLITGAFFFSGCSKAENEAVSATSPSFSKPAEVKVVDGFSSMSGLIYTRRNTATVPTNIDSALIVYSFAAQMTASATVELRKVADNSIIPVTLSWNVGHGYSTLTAHPTSALEPEKLYWIKLSGSSITDTYGNRLDLDGDDVGGETVDDDYEFYFVTYNNSGAAGVPTDPAVLVVDREAPAISGGLFCWINTASVPATNIYVDAPFYLRLTDQNLLLDRSDYDAVTGYAGTINDSKIWLINNETKVKIACTITFGNDPDATYGISNSTVRIQPAANLEPGKTYQVVIKENAIMDAAGNKMDTDDGLGQSLSYYPITTDDSLVGGGVVRNDITPPAFTFSAVSMKIIFTERVTPATLNGSTIWYKDGANVERPFVISVFTEYTNSGAPVTVVHLTPEAGHDTGTLYVNLRKISDLNGNFGTTINSASTF